MMSVTCCGFKNKRGAPAFFSLLLTYKYHVQDFKYINYATIINNDNDNEDLAIIFTYYQSY